MFFWNKKKKELNRDNSIDFNNEDNNIELFICEDSPNLKRLIHIENLHKTFGKNEVLKGIDFRINQGQHIALLGSNGAGKTVTIETIAGLIEPTSGSINYHFETVDLNKQIGIQFQAIDFPSNLTPWDVIKFNKELLKIEINDDELDEMITMFGIKPYIKKRCSKLSGGQKQRLNVLLSLLNKPKIIFLDEFSTGLDFSIKYQIETFISEYAKRNKITIAVVSHDINEIEFFADKIVVIHKGKVVLSATKEQVIEKFGSIKNLMIKYIR